MDISKISMGKDAPNDIINVIIEVPANSNVKYELDKDSGAVVVDRICSPPCSTLATMALCRKPSAMMAIQ